MPVPLSLDLGKRIIAAKLKGDTQARISSDKSVHTSTITITKLWALYRATGSCSPCPNPRGRKPGLSSEQLERVRAAIFEQSDITLQELKDRFSFRLAFRH
jgi:transposase